VFDIPFIQKVPLQLEFVNKFSLTT